MLRVHVLPGGREACDLLAPVYHRTGGTDGRGSIEVDPRLSHDPEATIAMARTLGRTVGRDNLFIKIPATPRGWPRSPR